DSPMHPIYAHYSKLDPRIEWIVTNDPLDFRDHYCPPSYRYNQAVREGKVTGTFSMVMPDDDLIHPAYIETMTKTALANGHSAVYSSQEWVRLRDGVSTPAGGLTASQVMRGGCV